MRYMGGKKYFAKNILPIILEKRKIGQWYVEPFCGGCNVIDKVYGKLIRNNSNELPFLGIDNLRLAADKNKYLIELFRGILKGERGGYPITREMYSNARKDYYTRQNNYYTDFEIAWIGFMGSYNGRFYDAGYARITDRNWHIEAINNLINQIGLLNGVRFECCDYRELDIPPKSLIYCDPPYKGTKKYEVDNFDHDIFWEWCRRKRKEGHLIFISEKSAPRDFICVLEKENNTTIDSKQGKKYIERLFTLK